MNELITQGPGGWVWDGTQWTCCDGGSQLPCPPGPPPWYPPPQGQPPWYPGANGGVSFSPPGQPPPNPIRGAFWFDGAALWLFDGAAWQDVGVANASTGGAGGGAFTGSNPPSNPSDGALWFNGSVMYIWDGNAWVPTSQTKTYVQATAPPAPNPGDQWWNGSQMYVWSGSVWNVVGPGATVGPVPTTTTTFSMAQTTDITGLAAGSVIVPFTSSPQIDTQTAYDPISKKITPTKAGVYMYMVRMYIVSVGGYGFVLEKNDPGTSGTDQTNNIVAVQTSSAAGWLQGLGMVNMNGSTDYVRLWAYTSGTWHGSANPCLIGYLMP